MDTLCARVRYFSAMAPAATRPVGGGREKVSWGETGLDWVGEDRTERRKTESGKRKAGHTNSFPRAASAPPTASLDAIFLQVSEIGMAGSRVEVHSAITVVLWSLVLIQHQHADRGAEGEAELGPGLDLHSVLFVSRRGQRALARSSSRHLRLDICLRERHAGGAAIHDTAHGPAVRFSVARWA
jgi:hypothetical protein